MAAIHTLDWPGERSEPVPFYHHVAVDWPELARAAKYAQVEWAEALERALPRLVELTSLVNSAPVGDQVWCHRDLKNTNVLRPTPAASPRPPFPTPDRITTSTPDRTTTSMPARTAAAMSARQSTVAEGNWLVDWDNVGPLAPVRELGALLMRHLDRPDNLRRIVDAYRAAGGPAQLDGPDGFATGIAIHLNFLHGQANAAMDTELADAHRQYADQQLAELIASLPTTQTLQKATDPLQP